MGAASSLIGLGLGVTATPGLAHGQQAGAPLLDADYVHNRYRYGAQRFVDEAGFLAAIGATKSGLTRTIAPKPIGPELATNGDFATDLSGWSQNGTGDITLNWVAGTLQMARGAGGIAGRARQSVAAGGPGRALRIEVTPSLNGVVMVAENNGGAGITANLQLGSSGQWINYCSSGNALPAGQVNLDFWPQDAGQTAAIDDVSVREVSPLVEHSSDAIAVVVDFVTPATASGNKVLWQADCNTERDRLRIVWDASAHLRVITTLNNVEQASLDLGEVAVATAGQVRVSAATDAVRASLDGTGIRADTTATHPGLAFLRTGRSVTGEAWDGEIRRVQLFNRTLTDAEMVAPRFGLQVYGDSTAAGAGAGVPAGAKWYNLLGAAYDPARPVNPSGVGGEDTAQLLARVAADTSHRCWTTIFMDRPNDNAEAWIANLKAAAALLDTERWLVVPPVLNSPSGSPDAVAAIIATVQSALLGDPFFTGHSFDATAQAAYATALNDDATRIGGTDWTHFNATGQAIQSTHIKSWLDAQGW